MNWYTSPTVICPMIQWKVEGKSIGFGWQNQLNWTGGTNSVTMQMTFD